MAAEDQEDEQAPAEAASGHDGTHPGHEADEAAHHLALDPDGSGDPGIPEGDAEVEDPDQADHEE